MKVMLVTLHRSGFRGRAAGCTRQVKMDRFAFGIYEYRDARCASGTRLQLVHGELKEDLSQLLLVEEHRPRLQKLLNKPRPHRSPRFMQLPAIRVPKYPLLCITAAVPATYIVPSFIQTREKSLVEMPVAVSGCGTLRRANAVPSSGPTTGLPCHRLPMPRMRHCSWQGASMGLYMHTSPPRHPSIVPCRMRMRLLRLGVARGKGIRLGRGPEPSERMKRKRQGEGKCKLEKDMEDGTYRRPPLRPRHSNPCQSCCQGKRMPPGATPL